MDKRTSVLLSRIVFIGTAIFLGAVSWELYIIAWGTGAWLGNFSLKWGLMFFAFAAFCLLLLVIVWTALWKPQKLLRTVSRLFVLRGRLGSFRWALAVLILGLPVWFFQYTLWGIVFSGPFFRLLVWALMTVFLGMLFTQEKETLITWPVLLASVLLSSAGFALASAFSNVTNYPFNLYWSDGNRLWDYSIMFGRHLYNYPPDKPIDAFISPGRQFLWGLPFLLPHTSIIFNRFWSALVLSLPYAVLGWVAFRAEKGKKREWLLVGLWAFLFLNQGPIYTPLVLSAILVAIAWERPLWLAMPIVAFAGYYAEETRWTWEFAPAIWAGMLELSGIPLKNARLTLRSWGRAISLAIAGVSIWYFLPLVQKTGETSNALTDLANTVTGTASNIQTSISSQPLLWYRLFPNDTYPEGILLGLIIAILPLAILLIYLARKRHWQPSTWQKLAMLGPLLAFLVVGLIISAKIGGGNNLHNLDMFLVALLFVAAVAWKNGGSQWLARSGKSPLWIKITLILLFALPAFSSLRSIHPRLSLTPSGILQVKTLTDYDPLTSPPIESMPSDEEVQRALAYISASVEKAEAQGEVLFIDQRQLLTFGYVPNVPLVPEYEKKRMMNEAMTGSNSYFQSYYQDLARQRFSLIITEPLKVNYRESTQGVFSEENDAWTKWVAEPTLCFYEPVETFKNVHVQLLAPRQDTSACTQYLQQETE